MRQNINTFPLLQKQPKPHYIKRQHRDLKRYYIRKISKTKDEALIKFYIQQIHRLEGGVR
jgi:hypothetical protein